MTAPTVVHHDKVTTERAVLCADGTVHWRSGSYDNATVELHRQMFDESTDSRSFCGGAPHIIATRKRITTAWEPQT